MNSKEINIFLIENGFRKLYQMDDETFYPRKYIFNDALDMGKMLGYIYPSNHYASFRYGIIYELNSVYIYGQKLPCFNHQIIKKIIKDIKKMSIILGKQVNLRINIYP